MCLNVAFAIDVIEADTARYPMAGFARGVYFATLIVMSQTTAR